MVILLLNSDLTNRLLLLLLLLLLVLLLLLLIVSTTTAAAATIDLSLGMIHGHAAVFYLTRREGGRQGEGATPTQRCNTR